MGPLFSSLLDLLRELDSSGIPLTIGGGFGLYLKRLHLERTGERTLFSILPAIRSTNDIDLFLRAEVLSDLSRTRQVADAIRRLGYTPVEEAKFLQWTRPITVAGTTQEVKIDILVGPLGQYRDRLKVSAPRVRPRGEIEFHAHTVEEALHIEDQPIRIPVEGLASDGTLFRGTVYVPEAFPYLMMKLHAFSDRKADANKDLGRHHALDTYAIVGMMTEAEFERAKRLGVENREEPHVERARAIVGADFSSPTALGLLRLREHPLFVAKFMTSDLVSVLAELFPH
jgi:hypothetical protein